MWFCKPSSPKEQFSCPPHRDTPLTEAGHAPKTAAIATGSRIFPSVRYIRADFHILCVTYTKNYFENACFFVHSVVK